MKEDILEQLVEDYYVSKPGWFVKHNIKFRPLKDHPAYNSKKDSVNSDIDIIAIDGRLKDDKNDLDRVHVVSCKSWQGGFRIKEWLNVLESEASYNKKKPDSFQKKEPWKLFRELISDKWIDSFLRILMQETGQTDFTYIIAVTKINGSEKEKERLENSEIIKKRFKKKKSNIKIRILTLESIIDHIKKRIEDKETPVIESTDVGRIMQLFYAAKIEM